MLYALILSLMASSATSSADEKQDPHTISLKELREGRDLCDSCHVPLLGSLAISSPCAGDDTTKSAAELKSLGATCKACSEKADFADRCCLLGAACSHAASLWAWLPLGACCSRRTRLHTRICMRGRHGGHINCLPRLAICLIFRRQTTAGESRAQKGKATDRSQRCPKMRAQEVLQRRLRPLPRDNVAVENCLSCHLVILPTSVHVGASALGARMKPHAFVNAHMCTCSNAGLLARAPCMPRREQ